MAKQGISDGGLRVGVKGGGCSGLSYTFAWERERGWRRRVRGPTARKIFVDKKSLLF
jgi:iron-sulfur cluster assembly protein